MVFIHIKKNDESVFLADLPAQSAIDHVIQQLVQIHNTRLRLERLCLGPYAFDCGSHRRDSASSCHLANLQVRCYLRVATEDLTQYGIYKPEKEHGYSESELEEHLKDSKPNANSTDNAPSSSGTVDSIVQVDGRQYTARSDPTGRRKGLGTRFSNLSGQQHDREWGMHRMGLESI
jgi:hypothetical protein